MRIIENEAIKVSIADFGAELCSVLDKETGVERENIYRTFGKPQWFFGFIKNCKKRKRTIFHHRMHRCAETAYDV